MSIPATIVAVHESSARSDAAYATAVDHSPIADGVTPPREWRPMPGELVSLWDMLRVYAENVLLLQSALGNLRGNLKTLKEFEKQAQEPIDSVPYYPSEKDNELAELRKQAQEKVAEMRVQLISGLPSILDMLANLCVDLELKVSLAQIEELRELATSDANLKKLSGKLGGFWSRVRQELHSRIFWYVPSAREKYGQTEYPFGEEVTDRFPKQSEDVVEASRCLCFGRYTATVFHLMRVMERSVHVLAKRLKITPWSIEEKEWGKILTKINDALDAEDARIQAMAAAAGPRIPANRPAWAQIKQAKRKLAARRETAAYLHHVKDAWRNDTMHAKRTYTQEQAEEVFKNVRTFMRSLVGVNDPTV
jgi:hypothetical protein